MRPLAVPRAWWRFLAGALLASALLLGGLLWWGQGEWQETPYDRVVPVAADRLRVEWTGGACDLEWAPAVEEDDREVRVLVRRRVQRGACEDLGVVRSAEVRLDADLADRELVNAACPPAPAHRPGCR